MKLDISAPPRRRRRTPALFLSLDAAGLTDDIVCGTAEFFRRVREPFGLPFDHGKKPLFRSRCAARAAGKRSPLSETYALDCPVRVEGTGEDDGESDARPGGRAGRFCGRTAESFLLLSLPSRYLCRADCRGLCPECGRDLNEGTCTCGGGRVDPRLESCGCCWKKRTKHNFHIRREQRWLYRRERFQGEKRQETQLRLEAPASPDDEVPQVRRGYSFTQSLQELRHLRRQRGIEVKNEA